MPEANVVTRPDHKRALDRRDLDGMVCPCGRPDCGDQQLSIPCHPLAPVILIWRKATATLGTQCAACGAKGPDIAVAEEAPSDA